MKTINEINEINRQFKRVTLGYKNIEILEENEFMISFNTSNYGKLRFDKVFSSILRLDVKK